MLLKHSLRVSLLDNQVSSVDNTTVTLVPISTKELLHKGWGSPRPPHKVVITAPHQVGRSMTCRRASNAPRGRRTESSFGSIKNHSTKAQGLANSLSKELTFHNTLKCVLRTKDMITKLLDGLEMFLGVDMMFLNSSNLQMTGGSHIYRPPSP